MYTVYMYSSLHCTQKETMRDQIPYCSKISRKGHYVGDDLSRCLFVDPEGVALLISIGLSITWVCPPVLSPSGRGVHKLVLLSLLPFSRGKSLQAEYHDNPGLDLVLMHTHFFTDNPAYLQMNLCPLNRPSQ